MIKIFQNNQFGEIRVTTNQNNEPLFNLTDVAKALGYVNPQKAVRDHCKGVNEMDTPSNGGVQKMKYGKDSNIYRLVMRSKLQEAEMFQDWVCEDVLPSIRKHGAYMTTSAIEKALTDPDTLIQLATTIKDERKQKELYQQQAVLQSKVINENAPKVKYYNEVLQSESTYTTSQIAKELGKSAIALNRLLAAQQIQYKQSGVWLLYAKYQDKGFTKTKTKPYNDNGEIKTAMLTVWTEKGREFIHGLVPGKCEHT